MLSSRSSLPSLITRNPLNTLNALIALNILYVLNTLNALAALVILSMLCFTHWSRRSHGAHPVDRYHTMQLYRRPNAVQKTQRPRSFSSAALKELAALEEMTVQDPHPYTMKTRKGLCQCGRASKCNAGTCKTHKAAELTSAPHPYTLRTRTGLRGCCACHSSPSKRKTQRPRSMSAQPSDVLNVLAAEQKPQRPRSVSAWPAEQKTQRPRSFSSAALAELDAIKEETFQDPHPYTKKTRKGLTGCSTCKCGASTCTTHAEGEHTPAPHSYTMKCRTGLRGCCAKKPCKPCSAKKRGCAPESSNCIIS